MECSNDFHIKYKLIYHISKETTLFSFEWKIRIIQSVRSSKKSEYTEDYVLTDKF